MNKTILPIARRKLAELKKKYNFNNIVIDNWRGWRFVFDSVDVENCQNDCLTCPLYNLLRAETNGEFSAGLYPASRADQKLFGPQIFLNCKTLGQYRDCYVNFFLCRCVNELDIKKELLLVKNLRVIYSRGKNARIVTKDFKKSIINKAMLLADKQKRFWIKKYADEYL